MHKVAADITAATKLPLFHIADATAAEIVRAGHRCVGLLATRFTMEQAFYKDRLTDQYGLRVLTPDDADREIVHRIIYDELCLGTINEASRQQFRRIMADLIERGAQAIILGCTEIGLLVGPADCSVPQFDTTAIHARKAAEFALA
jgi:aspartate racemase